MAGRKRQNQRKLATQSQGSKIVENDYDRQAAEDRISKKISTLTDLG
jgi:hypothetical protein